MKKNIVAPGIAGLPIELRRFFAVVPPGLGRAARITRFCRGAAEHVPIGEPVGGFVPVRHPIAARANHPVEGAACRRQIGTCELAASGLVKRLVALTHEHANFSRELSSNLPLRGLPEGREASGQLLFDGVVWRFEPAQSQFCCQIVHRYFSGSVFASKPVLDCGDPASAQFSNVENDKAPSASQIVLPLLYVLALEKCMDVRFGATVALFIRHLAPLS